MRSEPAVRPTGPPRAGGPGDPAGTGGPPGEGHALEGPLARSLLGHPGLDGHVRVIALGVRDELADDAAASVEEWGDGTTPVHVYGHQVVVGPSPGSGQASAPCPTCLARRWQAVRPGALRDALELGSGTRAAGEWPFLTAFAADAVAALIAAHREREDTAAGDDRFASVHLLDLETLRVNRAALIPDAECPRCDRRTDDTAEGARIVLGSVPKEDPAGFRRRGIDAYDLPLEAFVNPVAGMLGPSVAPDLTSASTASTVGAFTLRSGAYLRESYWGGHTDSYARSVRVGVLEGMERFAGMRARGKRTTVVASLAELGSDALDPRACGLYPDAFHRAHQTVLPFSPQRRIPWVWGYSLRDHRPLLVPEVLAYYHAPGGVRNRFVQESSNGCASGGCLEEAVYFGLMEAVERDAFLLAWYGRVPLPEIDPATSSRPGTRQMADRLAMYGYRARFFDTRISFPIPVVTAVAQRADGGPGTLCFGAGASWDPEAALSAGLCEIATDAVKVRRRTERDHDRLSAMAADFDKVLVLHDHPLVYGLPEMAPHAAFLLDEEDGTGRPPPRAVAELATGRPPAADLREDLDAAVEAVTGQGFDVVVVDQTMPEQRDLGLHTAAVLVPGLLPIDFGWQRQRALHMPRLRTALREAGRLDHDLRAADLNPAPHPFP
ncbi:TOMM precursor leader peptide-binding protein [Streptomyces sp. H39-S7]|uniref:TOMM precursor leader peptide-binding protein n=1 Tax=Streptomyces sp. H39-S7 TaxID=3004357 RepID=UPI0022AF713C|nr:TOMM precursor leader peptide-binding protein [Streptomyces sp. H39-S7]MCZ4124580.1 TOMM precursor leader peptide-binding protein [Streptomyces sp. H39-S7]